MRTLWLEQFDCDEQTWSAFQIPIGLAFFMRSSQADTIVAFYPSPAGATESELGLDAWEALVSRNPVLAELDADAEALVVNRLSDPHQYVIAPIDDCYALVGLIKSRWEGISGGSALEQAVPSFFEAHADARGWCRGERRSPAAPGGRDGACARVRGGRRGASCVRRGPDDGVLGYRLTIQAGTRSSRSRFRSR